MAVSYYFYISISNVQSAYLIQINRRSIKEKKIHMPKGQAPPRTLWYYERVVLRLSDRTFRSHFRISKTTFNNLCHLLGPRLASNVDGQDGRPNTPIEKQILPVLWLLATPDSYRSVADRFNIAKSTLFYFFERFVVELSSMSSGYIKWPTLQEMVFIRKQFYKINGFDIWIIGAVDGTYIVIKAPKNDAEVFRTRLCNFAFSLQCICIPSLHFTDCFVGFPGSVGDRRIFESSPLYADITRSRQQYFPSREYIVGDKAYPVLDWLQAPYIRRTVLNDAQELYNTLLSGARQVIERAFALLFGRFRRLKFVDMIRHDLLLNMVISCCVLHNISIAETDLEDFINEGLAHAKEMSGGTTPVVPRSSTSLSGNQRREEITAAVYLKHLAGLV